MDIYKEERPWGSFTQFTKNQLSTVKTLTVKAGESISLQYHNDREEFWKVLSGEPNITVGEVTHTSKPDDEFFIHKKENHCASSDKTNSTILEISFGQFDENDIVRIEDKYDRK